MLKIRHKTSFTWIILNPRALPPSCSSCGYSFHLCCFWELVQDGIYKLVSQYRPVVFNCGLELINKETYTSNFFYNYSRTRPVTRTRITRTTPLTRTNFHFPWIWWPHFSVIFTRLTRTRITRKPRKLELNVVFLDQIPVFAARHGCPLKYPISSYCRVIGFLKTLNKTNTTAIWF